MSAKIIDAELRLKNALSATVQQAQTSMFDAIENISVKCSVE